MSPHNRQPSDARAGFTIKVVAQRTGVPLHTLRAWERRYGVPKPSRVPGNRYRLYDEDDIADVLWLKRQVESGLTPSQASLLLREQGRGTSLSAANVAPQPMGDQQQALQNALLDSDGERAQRALDEALALFTPEQVVQQIIEPTLRVIGDRWLTTQSGVWQEHLASNLLRQRLLAVIQALPAAAAHAPRVIAACAPDEQHELGLLVFALLARRQGWAISYLGQRTPLVELTKVQRETRARVIALSATSVPGLTSLIPLFSEERPDASLMFGGHIFNRVPALREHLPGVFAGADAGQAVHTLTTASLSARTWTPPKKLLNAARTLQTLRLTLASDTLAMVSAHAPRRLQAHTPELDQATLFLVDTLSCALAFDAPELMDAEGTWLRQAMPPRAVPTPLIAQYLDVFEAVAHHALASAETRLVKNLLARMRASLLEMGEAA